MLPIQDTALKDGVRGAGGALLVQLAADADADLGREGDALRGKKESSSGRRYSPGTGLSSDSSESIMLDTWGKGQV
jgi:hypothetical protein